MDVRFSTDNSYHFSIHQIVSVLLIMLALCFKNYT